MHPADRFALLLPALLLLASCGGGPSPADSTSATTSAGSTGELAGTGGAGDGAGGAEGAASSGTGAGGACSGDTSEHTGFGTYYDADGSGNCSFDPTGDLMVGAMNHAEYAGSAVCGACVRLQGPLGEAVVKIVDQCPECPPGAIDLSPLAFAKLADLPLGKITVKWEYVECDVSGPIRYHFKEGSNQWWTAVQIRNSRSAVAKVEYAKGGSFVEIGRLDYNYFVVNAGLGPGPYTFRVTDVEGQVLVDEGVSLVEAGDWPGAAQFPSCGK